MTITLTTPALNSRHGGLRNIFEVANRLQDLGHAVYLYSSNGQTKCDWFDIRVKIITPKTLLAIRDTLIVCSPHDIDMFDSAKGRGAKNKFVWMQMVEHLFKPNDKSFRDKCEKFYHTKYPMLHGSYWGLEYIGRVGVSHYVGTGVNLDHFPISYDQKDENIILLESPEPGNPCKDVDRLALRAAGELKKQDKRIIAYGAKKITELRDNVDEFYLKPSAETMNELYSRASVLIKATVYDARATAPLEAMTKGCVTIRAIREGDDDLTPGYNCLKTDYNYEMLLNEVNKWFKMSEDERKYIRSNCYYYVQKYSWDYWMSRINQIITNE